jgi:tetratricopeptide (TPR) repeat protein
VRRALHGLALALAGGLALLASPGRAVARSRSEVETPQAKAQKALKLYELVHTGDLLVASGQIDKAIDFYNDFRFNFAQNVVFWRRFARLYEQKGDLERSLGCLDHLPRLEGTELADVVRQAELLWRLRRPEAALARLVGSKEQARAEDSTFWKLLYDLAWNQEQDYLALEALRHLWTAERDPAVALDLFNLVQRSGNYDEASEVVIAALPGPPAPQLLLNGVRFAIEGRRFAAAGTMIERAENRDGYARYAEFYLARGLLALETDRPLEADRDFARAVAIDPEAGGCPAWLEAGVLTESLAIAEHAIARCQEREARRPGSWDLLADVYRVVGQPLLATSFRARARERASWPEPREYPRETPPAEMDLQEAMDRGDKPAVARLLAAHGATVSSATRITALETLDRHDEAWAELERGGYTRGDVTPRSTEEAVLIRRAHWLKDDHLSGTWVSTQASRVGALGLYGVRLRAEQRWRWLYAGIDVTQARITLPEPRLLAAGRDEVGLGVTLRRRWARDESKLAGGARFTPTGWMPQALLSHATSWFDAQLSAQAELYLGRLPISTGALRTNALLDGVDVTATYLFPSRIEVRVSADGGRLAARDRALIGYQADLVGEAAQRWSWRLLTLRPRLFVEQSLRHNEPYLPSSVLPAILRGADPEALWLDGYTATGVGLALGNSLGQELDGRGPHPGLRYSLQGTASYAFPSYTRGFGAEASLSAVFARHQEVGAAGFFYSGFNKQIGERNAGLSLTYVARWF